MAVITDHCAIEMPKKIFQMITFSTRCCVSNVDICTLMLDSYFICISIIDTLNDDSFFHEL